MHKKDMYYHVNKFISVVRSKCVNNTTIAPKAKNGPNGTICVFFKLTAINDIGNPINAPTTIDINALGIPNIKPKMANSFISPPPIDSCLNIRSPIFFNKNITMNATSADNNAYGIDLIPSINIFSISIATPKNINTSSGII